MKKSACPVAVLLAALFVVVVLSAQTTSFHGAPASAAAMPNPATGEDNVKAGQQLYQQKCAGCHGENAQGNGNVPALATGDTQKATPGSIFWFITRGDMSSGMPPWRTLPAQQRWQIVSYLKALGTPAGASLKAAPQQTGTPAPITAPPPTAPFTDFRYERPGRMMHITAADLPKPFATQSAGNNAHLVPRPENAWPKAPAGFKVEMYATGLDNPRLIRTAPNGDFFVAEMTKGDVMIFRGITPDGKPKLSSVFATGLNKPFGINFYPAGPNPQWVYVGDTDAVLRFPYHSGDLKATGPAQHLDDLPSNGKGHITRDIQFSPDGKKMFVSVGSGSNVDDPDTHPAEFHRANILEFNPDGSDLQVYASGIRNPVGLAVDPKTGELWCSVNERDALGDNLVPDYITHVQPGGFYGWPWWYIGPNQDPRHPGAHPELKNKVIVPDVLLQPHNASLEMTFYEGKMFPSQYDGDIFAAEHGSWNRGVRAGYEIIRVPLHHTGHSDGSYEEFITGFVLPNGEVWGRPVGVAVAQDGSLMFTDDGTNSIWRVTYTGK